MNPNSGNQLWSRWTWLVRPPEARLPSLRRTFGEVRANCARFGRKAFGSATQMKVEEYADGSFLVEARTDGAPTQPTRSFARACCPTGSGSFAPVWAAARPCAAR